MTNLEAYYQLRELATDATAATTKATISLLQTALAVSVAVIALLLALRPDLHSASTSATISTVPRVSFAWAVSVGIAALCIVTSASSLLAFWVALVRDRERLRARRDSIWARLQGSNLGAADPYDGPSSFVARLPRLFAHLAAIAILLLAILGLSLALLAVLYL